MKDGSFATMYVDFVYGSIILFTQDCLSPLSMQALPAPPESLCVLDMSTQSDSKEEGEGGLYLNIGLQVNTQH